MSDAPRCWKCGAVLDTVPQPLSRHAECPACTAELHVCRMCRFFDPAAPGGCREPIAEPVADKARANFCGYLEVRADAYRPESDPGAARARTELADLFGDAPSGDAAPATADDEARAAAERLFRGKDPDAAK